MNNFELCIIPNNVEQDEPDQSLREAFESLLNDIYYEGYSKQLAEESLEAYNREYFYFVELYGQH